ncbi:MAG: heavy metal-responsive transcriptional regulator [Actinomycetota bacterium]
MRIGDIARAAGVSTATIRYYESIGLIGEPARTASGYRDYSAAAVERLDFVKQAQATGLCLDEIASILAIKDDGGRSCEHSLGLLARHLDALDAHIDELHRARVELREMYDRAAALDPDNCVDPNRCQIIASGSPDASPLASAETTVVTS